VITSATKDSFQASLFTACYSDRLNLFEIGATLVEHFWPFYVMCGQKFPGWPRGAPAS
jgi:hypothetical protein